MNELSPQTKRFDNIALIIEHARQRVRTAVNTAMVYSYFEIGRHIAEHEQKGDSRAEYGKALLKELSAKLTARFGEGWGKSHLHNIKQFYLTYSFKQTGFSKQCLENPQQKSGLCIENPKQKDKQCPSYSQSDEIKHFVLFRSHDFALIRIKDATTHHTQFSFKIHNQLSDLPTPRLLT